MEKHILSKSTFVKGHQCEKALYLYKFNPELRAELDEQTLQVMNAGTNVGVLAQKLYPNGVDATLETTFEYQKSVLLTQQLIAAGKKVIYEACFQYNGVLCALDILVKKKDKWYAYEVKSSTTVKDYHYTDTALQYYVITKSGLPLEDIAVIHLNNKYSRLGELDVKQLFNTVSVKDKAIAEQQNIETKIAELKKVMENKNVKPTKKIGTHCFSPFECEFKSYCWDDLNIDPMIFNLYSKDFNHFIENEIFQFDEIDENYKFHGKSKTKLNKLKETEIKIDKAKISSFLKTFIKPYYYFDFETYQMAVPEFDKIRPYQMIPFQYSLHIQDENNLIHSEFLGDSATDPRIPLIEKMINELGEKGSIITYNATFEKTRLKEMAIDFPAYKKQLNNIKDRIVDLMVPFQKMWYYNPKFKASYSIKYVLPALIPSLSYQNLNIQNGGDASSIYPKIKDMKLDDQEKTRTDLLEYCKLDTLAMVKIHEHLFKII